MPAARPDLHTIFQPIAALGHVALAVSGGSDSMAMLRLATEWRDEFRRDCKLSVLTVDHGLRPGSAAEAEKVAARARGLGLDQATLHWAGSRGGAGLQARARKARYDLMASWCREQGAEALLTAHTLDDQAETVLMRLSRTASIDSLAAIRGDGHWAGTRLVRPLLAVRREALRAYLTAIGQGWIEDPSNGDPRFER
ncbi:MAG: tRNA lysidine(34) synthetase TilS, partial [Alphaproteobacteria bacterium]|nr:tRNA lysidine(34) synthetase TilS [Alphaproteobacteria bacterium]